MIIYSGHDDNVASFMMNFFPENYKCIADNFKSNEIIDLDLSMLNAGTYIAKVKTEKNNFVQKIIKN